MSVLSPEPQYLPASAFGGYQRRLAGAGGVEDEAARRAASLATLRNQAQQLGLADVEGTGARGFLTAALDYLSRPGSAVIGALTPGMAQEGEPADSFSRFMAGLTGAEQYRGSDIVGEAADNASIVERLLRAGAGFGIDVATDPLTYLTFGRGGTLRGAGAARATEAQVGRAVREVIPPATQARVTAPVTAGTATEAAAERARGGIRNLTDQPVVPLGQGRTTPTLSRPTMAAPEAAARAPRLEAPEIETRVRAQEQAPDDFADRIAAAAAEGQIVGGGEACARTSARRCSSATHRSRRMS